ncbi:MAG: 50S ribosomal protein L10 [Candidatus Omnitrophica bacterium]|nr:50S ribosomal protein L10 [Candidatus Omnitrophota bacterium]
MKKLGVLFKDTSARMIRDNIRDSGSFFIIRYTGLSGLDMSNFRKTLKGSSASLMVVRNKIAMRILADMGKEDLNKMIDGPCGFIFIKDEPVNVSKAVCDFLKDHEKLVVGGGLFGEKVLAKADIEAMSKVPSKEILRAQVVMGLKSPINGLVTVLNSTLRKFVCCLDQIRQKRGG